MKIKETPYTNAGSLTDVPDVFAPNNSFISEEVLGCKDHLDSIINNIPDAIFSIDKKYQILTFNRACQDKLYHNFGIHVKVGDNILLMNDGNGIVLGWKEYIDRAFAGEKFKIETSFVKDGDTFYREACFNPIKKEEEIIGVTCLSRDTTDIRRNAERLKASEARFRKLIENNTDMMTLATPEGRILYASPSVSHILGYTEEELLTSPGFEFVHPDELPGLMADLEQILTQPGGLFFMSLRVRDKNGHYLCCEGTVTNMLQDPHVGALVANFRDATKRKRDEEKLRETIQEISDYKYALDQSSIVAITDQRGIISYVNDNFCKISQYTKEELIGQNHRIVNSGFHSDEFFKNLWKTIANGKIWRGEIRNRSKYGTIYWVDTTIIPFLNSKGKPYQYVSIRKDITKEKENFERLKEAELNYREIFENANDAICIHEIENGKIVDLNKRVYEITGYTKEEILNGRQERLMAGTPGFTVRDAMRYLQKAKHEGRQVFEWLGKQKNGNLTWFEVSLTRANIAGSDRILAFYRDIKYRKKAEEKLVQTELLLSEAQRLAKVGNWNYDVVKNEIFWSSGMKYAFGVGQDFEPSIYAIHSMIHDADKEKVIAKFIQSMKTGEPMQAEFRIVRPDKEERVLEGHVRVELNEEGMPSRIYGFGHDITSQKLAEESLQTSEARLRTIFNHTDEGYILLDVNLNILTYNLVSNYWAQLLYGKDLQEGLSWLSYVPDERNAMVREIMNSVLRGNMEDYEKLFDLLDGTQKWLRVRQFPVRNEAGQIIGVCIAARDITDRKIYELELEKMTAEIIQRNQDLEQFAYIVSHNLRAPVANITGLTDALQHDGLQKEEIMELMEDIDVSVRRLDNIITDLNHILQVKKQISEIKELVSFSEIVNDISISIRHMIEKVKAVIKTDFTEAGEMLSLKSYLYSIFFNLISNSIKYRQPDLPPVIEIKTWKTHDKLHLTFKDNGLGIDLEKESNQVFGLYKRFHPHASDGKGMGLFMVKTQVETLDGKISVASKVNNGVQFHIEFKIDQNIIKN